MIARSDFLRYITCVEVAVISINGEKWVTAESLQSACGNHEKPDVWRRRKKRGLTEKTDYIMFDNDLLFSREAAVRIFEAASRPKPAPAAVKHSRRGYLLDEDGLPILPSQKRKGPLINPYRF
jgi:hypothetical protein